VSDQTPEQRRAANAFQAVQALDENIDKEMYRSYVERIGLAILTNGLGQALATERAAAGKNPEKPDEHAHAQLYKNIEKWLCCPNGVYKTGQDLLEAITTHGEIEYMTAQTEALAWLVWHKKFCRVYLPRKNGES